MRTPHSATAQRVGVITQTGSIIYNTDAGNVKHIAMMSG